MIGDFKGCAVISCSECYLSDIRQGIPAPFFSARAKGSALLALFCFMRSCLFPLDFKQFFLKQNGFSK